MKIDVHGHVSAPESLYAYKGACSPTAARTAAGARASPTTPCARR
jgi:hypothetical protein